MVIDGRIIVCVLMSQCDEGNGHVGMVYIYIYKMIVHIVHACVNSGYQAL